MSDDLEDLEELEDDRVSMTEAAEMLGLSTAEFRHLVDSVAGIEAVRSASRWRINPDSLPDRPMPATRHRPIVLRNSRDGWLENSTNPGDRAPRRQRPPEEIPQAPWRIVRPADPRPADPRPEDPSA